MASRVLGPFALGLTLTGALACRGDGGPARAAAPPAAAPAVPAALVPLADACTGGDARACYDLGVHFQVGDGVTLDYGQARALFERSCAAGDTYGCNGLGRLYQDGHGVDRDPARAMALYRQACAGGDAPVCYWVGYLEARGELGPVDLAAARRDLDRACDGGYDDACVARTIPPVVPQATLDRDLAALIADAGVATLAAATGRPHDPRFDAGDPGDDLRATTVDPRFAGATPTVQATIWSFDWSQSISAGSYVRLQAMAFVFPDRRLRWLAGSQQVPGRSDRALMSAAVWLEQGPPALWWATERALTVMRAGTCDLEPVTAADVAALPAPIRADVAAATAGAAASCARMQAATGEDQWLPVTQWLAVIVEHRGAAYMVRSNLHVVAGGRLRLEPVTITPL